MNERCERTDERMAPNLRPDSRLFCPCTGAYLLVQHAKVAVFVLLGLLLAAYLPVQHAKVAVLVLLGLLLAAALMPEVVTRRTEIFVSRSAEDGERTMGADQKH